MLHQSDSACFYRIPLLHARNSVLASELEALALDARLKRITLVSIELGCYVEVDIKQSPGTAKWGDTKKFFVTTTRERTRPKLGANFTRFTNQLGKEFAGVQFWANM